jgi:hypothetical protein
MNNKYEIYVNEPLGVVVAKMSRADFFRAVFDTAMSKVLKKYKNTMIGNDSDWCSSLADYILAYFNKWVSKRNTEKNIVARARCNFEDGDVFDEKIGIYIACDRMDIKIANTATDFLVDFTEGMSEFVRDVEKTAANIYEFCKKTNLHVEDLTSFKD